MDAYNFFTGSSTLFGLNTAESADLTDVELEGAEVGSVIFKDKLFYLVTENGLELLGEDTTEYAEYIEVNEVEATTTPTVSTAATPATATLSYATSDNINSTNYFNLSYSDFVRTMQPIDSNDTTATDSTNSNSSKSTKGVVPVGTVLCIGGIYYLVVDGGIELIGEGSVVDGGGNIIIAQPGSSPNITINNSIEVTEINNTQTYIYNEGDKIINNYEIGQLVHLDLSGYRGIDLNGQSFFINTESGQLEIEDSRDKFVGYSDRDNNIVAYSYVASHKGLIDGRRKSGMLEVIMKNVAKADAVEILIGADNADNAIIAVKPLALAMRI